MTVGAPLAQALAYVDDCLAPGERRDVERKMAADPDLAEKIQQWRRQNEAIRLAFADQEPGEHEGAAESAPPIAIAPLPARREFGRRDASETNIQTRRLARPGAPPRHIAKRSARWRYCRRRGSVLIAACLALAWSAAPAPRDPSAPLASAAFSAFRTFADNASPEFATADAAALAAWLRPRLGASIVLPDLGAAGFTLIGGRVISGAEGPAAFALYRNLAGARIGLSVESGEAAPAFFSRASGALAAIALAAPGPERATLVAAKGAVDLDRLVRLARFPAP